MNEEKAMFEKVLPCNPIPFLKRIEQICRDEGFDAMRTNKVKACLWILNTLAYGQTTIDSFDEFNRLNESLIRQVKCLPKGQLTAGRTFPD